MLCDLMFSGEDSLPVYINIAVYTHTLGVDYNV